MGERTQRATIYFEPDIHKALRLLAAEENRSISELVNEAVRRLAAEDAEDLADLAARGNEACLGYAEFVRSLRADGVL